MEHSYKAYTKTINNSTYYFVKKYILYPELKNTPAILESYGMHTNFNKACSIANIQDPVLRQKLFREVAPGVICGQNGAPLEFDLSLSKSLRVEHINNKTTLVTRLTGIKKIISAKIPHWRLLPH